MSKKELFTSEELEQEENFPLAEKLRPKTLKDVIGQEHLTGEEGVLTQLAEKNSLSSMIFWGDPGTGKTSVARLLIEALDDKFIFVQISAIFSGVAELKRIFESARVNRAKGHKTLLFVDEIHRFNKTQQDCLLPVVEDGTVILIGATTENPSFELNKALLSRVRVLRFSAHTAETIEAVLQRAEKIENKKLPLDAQTRQALIRIAGGDARVALNLVEEIWRSNFDADKILSSEEFEKIIQCRVPYYDKNGDNHYNLISALHKAIRGSDADAALYYLARMLRAGEDPLYLARRLARIATEDIGLADPQALILAQAAKDHYHFVGAPEGELALAELCVYLATAPKSNALYVAYKEAMRDAKEFGSLMPPKHILNAPTKLMKQEKYGAGYVYDHNTKHAFSGQNYFPEQMERRVYYRPPERGFEREIKKRLEWWQKQRENQSLEQE